MYAVIDFGSFQFKVAEGDIIEAPQRVKEVGQSVEMDNVLLVSNGTDVRIGDPYLKGAKVTAEVVRHFKDEKDITFRFRKRKNSKKTTGHRQDLTALKIVKISV